MTPEELYRQGLAHEEHIARLLEIRNRGKRSHWWEHAGITALVGSVSAAFITFLGSYSLKSLEFGAQRRTAELSEVRREIREVNQAIAELLQLNEERFLMARGKMGKLTHAERETIRLRTNTLQGQWRKQREVAEMGVRLAFAGVPEVLTAWSSARGELETYTDCIEAAYERYQGQYAPPDTCKAENEQSRGAIYKFISAEAAAYSTALNDIQ